MSFLKTVYLTLNADTAGSLSMMPRDMDGVVDTNLKVYGTNNIRVADLSILPIHFAAHPLGKCSDYMRHVN